MKAIYVLILTALSVSATVFLTTVTAHAQPYGTGIYNADVGYGSATVLALSTNGSISIPITPGASPTLGTTTSSVTVTSSDVTGYKLYVQATGSSSLQNGSTNIVASSNLTAGVLSTNTWGYNTDGTANFIGITTTNALLKTASGPFKNGDSTTVTYGVKVDSSIKAGNYTGTVLYTAIPQTN